MVELIALTNALHVAALRHSDIKRSKASIQVGAFLVRSFYFLLIISYSFLANARHPSAAPLPTTQFTSIDQSQPNCASAGLTVDATLLKVVDGDSITLTDGRKVRVIGVNTPELANRGRGLPAEPLAHLARQQAIDFFQGSNALTLQIGQDAEDHYGRVLAHVYRPDGRSLEAYLLALGLAAQITIAPNLAHWQCLSDIESKARKQLRGLWAEPYYVTRQANQLVAKDAGYRRVAGKIERILSARNGTWWVEFEGSLSLRIAASNQRYFDRSRLDSLIGKSVEVSGWLIDRKNDQKVIKKGYSRWMLNISHANSIKYQYKQ